MPEFDVDVGTAEITEETVTVPTVEITPPGNADMASNYRCPLNSLKT